MATIARIDFETVKGRADLRSLVQRVCGEGKGGRYLCPFHDDHHPSLSLDREGKRFKCWSARCGASGDALDWLLRTGQAATVAEAAGIIDPTLTTGPRIDRGHAPAPEPIRKPSAPRAVNLGLTRSPEWQQTLDGIIQDAHKALWSSLGRPALDWLRRRGLEDWTIRKVRLGYVHSDWRSEPLDCLDGKPMYLPRGVLIPWASPEGWYGPDFNDEPPPSRWVGANVRKLRPDPAEKWVGAAKCQAASGSARGYGYPFGSDFVAGLPVLICEGEWDAVTAYQQIGHMLNVVTTGGAGQAPEPGLLAELREKCPEWLLAMDADDAGEKGATMWESIGMSRVKRLMLPVDGDDLNECHMVGVDLRAWLRSECERVGVTI